MIGIFTRSILGCFLIFVGWTAFGQITISGKVTDSQSGEPLIGVNVLVKGTIQGTITDVKGNFTLSLSSEPPYTLIISSVGYEREEIAVASGATTVQIQLKEAYLLGQEVVVSASRVEENTLRSPVSIQRMDLLDIKNTASTDFYDALKNMNGVDFSTQSLTFKSINARGFGSNGNYRFVQLIDGIDNQAPGLNFAVGNVVGINDLDLESMEMMPGAASALYGPNAIQGILLMRSKSPFEYQGLSAYAKTGINHVDGKDDHPSIYQDYAIRYAKAFNDKIAFKVTGSWLRANDFRGVDYRDQEDIVERSPKIDPNNRAAYRTYDGVNVYGDPLLNVGDLGQGTGVEALLPSDSKGDFTPTGYRERDFVNNVTQSLKMGAALHYRINDKMEILGQYNIGFGSTVYTANDRFVLSGFSIWTGKVELRGANFFLRGYTTQEDAGKSYAANTLASLINAQTTIPDYVSTFAGARLQGATIDQAHDAARASSDAVRSQILADGTFHHLYDSLRDVPISNGGARFLDESDLYHAEGSYNFDKIKSVDIVVGANFRHYSLRSKGTLFALDNHGNEIGYNEFGGYAQVKKSLLEDKLNLQGSVRYDKNVNFKGQFSPRVSAVLNPAGDHFFRGSFQHGFRIPTTQDQFIDLDVVSRRLVGSNSMLVDRYRFKTNTVYMSESVTAAQAANDISLMQVATQVNKTFKTEKVNTFEVGYKGLYLQKKLLIDAYYYYSIYMDFIAEIYFLQAVPNGLKEDPAPFDPDSDDGKTAIMNGTVATQEYGFNINATGNVKSQGWGLSATYFLPRGYALGGNVSYNELISAADLENQGFQAQYNTPKYRYNVSLSNRKVVDNLGFNVAWRWQEAFLWQSSIGQGVIPDYGTLDAQVSYQVDVMKTVIKIGGSNILNKRYTTSMANPRIGAIYYIQLTFDQFLN